MILATVSSAEAINVCGAGAMAVRVLNRTLPAPHGLSSFSRPCPMINAANSVRQPWLRWDREEVVSPAEPHLPCRVAADPGRALRHYELGTERPLQVHVR